MVRHESGDFNAEINRENLVSNIAFLGFWCTKMVTAVWILGHCLEAFFSSLFFSSCNRLQELVLEHCLRRA